MSTSNQQSFFQTWLFFGLLQVFMKEDFNAEDYKISVEGQVCITTAQLVANMQGMWVKQVQLSSKDKSVQFRTVVTCLRLIAQVLRRCNDDFDWRIKLSIASVCEVFSASVALAYKSLGIKQPEINSPQELGLHLFEDARKARMMSAGWCSNDIAIAAERFSSVQMLYFLSRMKKLDTQRDHDGCRDDMFSPAESKALAIELLEYTYQKASYVLVLDGGIVVCDYTEIPVYEALARIFTSAWLQRVWTLQEGVLAQDRLWFQFKDQPVNLKALMYTRFVRNITIQSFLNDTVAQYRIMCMSFLQDKKLSETTPNYANMGGDLLALDRALRHRSVTVDADEAICICTLLQLSAQDIARLPAEVEARMSEVWRLVPENTTVYRSEFSFSASLGLRRKDLDPKLGAVTEFGLLVKWPGFKLNPKDFNDLPVRNPWKALPRLRESRVMFKSEDGTRYQFSSKEHTTGNPTYKHAEGTFPLHEIIERGNCYLILAEDGLFDKENFKGLGILGNVTSSSNDGRILYFEAAEQVLVFTTSEKERLILDTAERLAHQLRREPLTAKLAAMDADIGTKEHEAVLELFRKRLDEACAEEDKSELLREAFDTVYCGTVTDPILRVLVRDWFYHEIVGTSLSAEQQWCVD
ncbi:hypothetical protein MMC11_004751 [Xylographa trunciseda]|nr:hypothetical protein [Xylographa trunciseda]